MTQTIQESLFKDTVLPTIAPEILGRDILPIGAYVTAHAGIVRKYRTGLSRGVDPMVALSKYRDNIFFLRMDNPAAAIAMAATIDLDEPELAEPGIDVVFPSLQSIN